MFWYDCIYILHIFARNDEGLDGFFVLEAPVSPSLTYQCFHYEHSKFEWYVTHLDFCNQCLHYDFFLFLFMAFTRFDVSKDIHQI